mgnify:CR=1 FL=1
MFKEALMIPVFVYTDEEIEVSKLGTQDEEELGFEKTEFRAFWKIESAHQYKDDFNRTGFHVGCESFVTPIKFKEFIQIINEQLKK